MQCANHYNDYADEMSLSSRTELDGRFYVLGGNPPDRVTVTTA
jgi:hypothetical protein